MSLDENTPKQVCIRFDRKIRIAGGNIYARFISLSIISVKAMLATKLNACYRIGKSWSGINVKNILPPHFS
jgi:hypothetical protein